MGDRNDDRALTDAELRVVVDRDEAALRAIGAYDRGGDPYTWVDECLRDGDRLVMPDTDPRTWTMCVHRTDQGDWFGADVELWTANGGGESDFELVLDVDVGSGGELRPRLRDIRPM